MKTSTLVLAAAIATAIYAQNIPREKFSRKSFTSSNNKQVDAITGNSKTLKRQDAVSNGTTGAEAEEAEPEEEEAEEEESESESESESSSSEEEEEEEEEEEPEAEAEEPEEGEPEEGEPEEVPEPSGQEAEAAGQEEEEEALPATEGGATSAAALVDGPSGQIAMGMGVENADGSCTCNVACPAGSLPM